jgi:hypothetical protein
MEGVERIITDIGEKDEFFSDRKSFIGLICISKLEKWHPQGPNAGWEYGTCYLPSINTDAVVFFKVKTREVTENDER